MKQKYISPRTQIFNLDSEHLMSLTTSTNTTTKVGASSSFSQKKEASEHNPIWDQE